MARDWETTFSSWTGPASDSEEDRYKRTKGRIEDALRADTRLAEHPFDVYPKGSYPNFTNVVADSDVDIAVEMTELYGYRMTHSAKDEGLTLEDVGGFPYTGDYSLSQFKDDVEQALRSAFGTSVTRGNKAIHIAETGGGLPADVVPCKTHRSWTSRHSYQQGIQLRNDAAPAQELLNYPAQHLEMGKQKNSQTDKRFKRIVRILKRLENEMVAKGQIKVVPSFLIESAVYSVPRERFFSGGTWPDIIREVLGTIYEGTSDNSCDSSDHWLEVNDIKYLFHATQPWSPRDINAFTKEAWNYAGF